MLQEKLLAMLEQSRGTVLSGGELARTLGVSRTAVWKAVHTLQEAGHAIQSIQGSGYRLEDDSNGISVPGIRKHLRTCIFGNTIEVHRTLGSTNQYLKEQGASLQEGHVVIADMQTAGRGRMGRSFVSPQKEGVYISILLRPSLPATETSFLTICAAVAVCRALHEVCGFKADIKWVNDIFHKEKKLCGILTEAFITAEMQSVDYAIVGIGINTGTVAPEVAGIATSVHEITGQRGIRNRLAAALLLHFENIYLALLQGSKKEILAEYQSSLFIIGRVVEVVQPRETYLATVLGIDQDGALLVHAEGEAKRLQSGEVHLKLERLEETP